MKNIFLLSLLLCLFACGKEDACENVSCKNGGTCANGDCNCPEKFTGSDCSQQKTPTRIKITGIEVTKFPGQNPSNTGWDIFDGPDIYAVLLLNNVEVFNTLNGYVENANSSNTYNLVVPANSAFENPMDTYTLRLMDYDGGGALTPDMMGGVIFQPYSSSNGFPSELDVSCATCDVNFIVSVSYQF